MFSFCNIKYYGSCIIAIMAPISVLCTCFHDFHCTGNQHWNVVSVCGIDCKILFQDLCSLSPVTLLHSQVFLTKGFKTCHYKYWQDSSTQHTVWYLPEHEQAWLLLTILLLPPPWSYSCPMWHVDELWTQHTAEPVKRITIKGMMETQRKLLKIINYGTKALNKYTTERNKNG